MMETKSEPRPNFLEVSIINELIENFEKIETKCRGKTGEDIVNERIRQLAYAKILTNVYNKEVIYLIKAHTQLGIAYLDINYFEQAQEHLLVAFKLNEGLTEELNLSMKEYQIKILINLSKCYLENNKTTAAMEICKRSLKMNQTLLGDDHVSNADIYYVLAKINTKTKNYKNAVENLRCMFEIYEKIHGFDSEKSAKICMELGQIYELSENIDDAIEYYRNSYSIWIKIIKDDNYEVLFTLAIKLAELYEKLERFEESYETLKKTETEYRQSLFGNNKKQISYKKLLIKYASLIKESSKYLEELLDLEKLLIEGGGEFNKSLAKTCISIASTYYQIEEREKALEYFEKAEKIFLVFGNVKVAKEIQARKEQLLYTNK